MKRRTFLQLTGMSTAGTLLAGCRQGNEKVIPFLVAPDDGVVPGQADYFASSCRQCSAGCGILVRISEGRAKKIEGNPRHPVNRGRLCARGQAALQELYHPDRIRTPLKRIGPRGSGEFTPISWEEALDILLHRLEPLRGREGAQAALFTPPLGGSMAVLAARFMETMDSAQQNHLAWELGNAQWQLEGSLASYGREAIPDYDIAQTEYLLSFGADFLETFFSPVGYGEAFGRMRQARPTVRGRFAYVGPRLSMTAASADRWLPARPGAEGALALGIARELLVRERFDRDALTAAGLETGALKRELAPYDIAAVAEATGVEQAAIRATVRDFAEIRPAVAMVGEAVAWQSNGAQAVKAVQLLNLMAGNLDRQGGISLFSSPHTARSRHRDLVSLVSRMAEGEIGALLVYRSNPVYSVPATIGFGKGLEKVPFVASFSPFLDDTARFADLILPDHADLESWGEVLPAAGGAVGLMQPVVEPLHDTQAVGDLLLAAGRSLPGGERLLPWASYREMIRDRFRQRLTLAGDDFKQAWAGMLQAGGDFEIREYGGEAVRFGQAGSPLPELSPPRFAGPAGEFPLHLQAYISPVFTDGRGAHLPWLQQLPDPMTTAVWGSWVELNPQTARQMGVAQGDLVEVRSPRGAVRLPALLYPGIRPEVVAIPVGQGHSSMGRYAEGRGVSALELLVLPEAEGSDLPAWGGTRVALRRLSGAGELVTAGHPEGSYRRELLGL